MGGDTSRQQEPLLLDSKFMVIMQAATKKDIEDSPVDIIINKGMEQAAGESTLKDEENSRRSLEVKKKMKNTV